jgi:hypothetical protein
MRVIGEKFGFIRVIILFVCFKLLFFLIKILLKIFLFWTIIRLLILFLIFFIESIPWFKIFGWGIMISMVTGSQKNSKFF